MERVDAIVVGSGAGGLVTASLLAQVGYGVLVLEQHDRAGGATHEWSERGWSWDVGVHYVGGRVWDKSSAMRAVFDATTSGDLGWERIDGVYDVAVLAGMGEKAGTPPDAGGKGVGAFQSAKKDVCVPMPPGLDRLKERLREETTPQFRGCVDKWFALMKESHVSSKNYFMTRFFPSWLYDMLGGVLEAPYIANSIDVTVSQALDRVGLAAKVDETPEERQARLRLRFLLVYILGDYGLVPSEAPLGIHAAVHQHYFAGSAFPTGGAEAFARGAARTIRAFKGRVLVGAKVDRLVIEGGRCVGVQMADGTKIRAPMVISGVGAPVTYDRLVPKDDPSLASNTELAKARSLLSCNPPSKALRPSVAHLQLFIGLHSSVSPADLAAANYWIYLAHPDGLAQSGSPSFSSADPTSVPLSVRDLPFPIWGVFTSFPAAKSGDDRKPTAIVIAEAPWEAFVKWQDTTHHKRGKDYEAFKDKIASALLDIFKSRFPGLADKVDYTDLGTPLSTKYYLDSPQGASYGLAHTQERFRISKYLRPQTPLPGLYITGQDVCSAGVAGAAMGGVLAAIAIAPVDVLAKFGDTVGLWKNTHSADKTTKKQQ